MKFGPVARAALLFLPTFACGGGGGNTEVTPLELVTNTLDDVALNATVNVALQAKGGVAPYTFSANGLPTGLSVSNVGLLAGIVTQPGRAHVAITVKDTQNATAMKTIDLYVIPAPLTIVTTSLPAGKEGSAYDQSLVATGGVPPLTWSLASGALPAGLMVESTGRITGTPAAFGVFDASVQVEDADGTKRDQALTLTFSALNPMITSTTMPRGRVDQTYDAMIEAEGGVAPYIFELAAGDLPPGMAVSAEGKISGAPSAAGDFTFSIRVSDASTPPRTDMAQVSINVIAALSIQTTQIAQAIQDRAYSFTMQAAGGAPPYTWQLGSGTMPAGITFNENGTFQGTSSELGDHMLTLRVRDAEGFQRSGLFTLKVSDHFIYEVTPAAAIPAICTATSVSYVTVPITIAESFAVRDVNITVDITYDWDDRDSAAVQIRRRNRIPGSPRLILFGPDGSQAPLCGNGAAVPGGLNCQAPSATNPGDMVKEWDDDGAQANRPERPLSVFDGINAHGTWLLAVGIAEPLCQFTGTINRVSLSIQDDRRPDQYVIAHGYRKNNLVTGPFLRTCTPACGGMIENELFLDARVYDVGPNGYPEAGQGDDIDQGVPFTWSWSGNPLAGVTLDADGHVSIADSGDVDCFQNACAGTGQSAILGNGGGHNVNLTLRVLPPDFNSAVREY